MPRVRSWLKMWIEWIHDPKMFRLSWAERGMWWALVSLAGECGAGGKLMTSAGEPMTLEGIAMSLHLISGEGKTLHSMIEKMEDMQSLHWNNDVLTITHWEDRQEVFPSERPEAVRDRVRRYRERKREKGVTEQSLHPLTTPDALAKEVGFVEESGGIPTPPHPLRGRGRGRGRGVTTVTSLQSRYTQSSTPDKGVAIKGNEKVVTDESRKDENFSEKKEIMTAYDSILATFSKLFEENIGLIGGLMAEELKDYAANYVGPVEWIRDSFLEAGRANVMKWSYIKAILDTWQREGRDGSRVHKHRGDSRSVDRAHRGRTPEEYGKEARRLAQLRGGDLPEVSGPPLPDEEEG